MRASPIQTIQLGFMPVITRSPADVAGIGWFRPQMTLRSVVLPAPLGPMMPTISPAPRHGRNVEARTPPNEIDPIDCQDGRTRSAAGRSSVAPMGSGAGLGSSWPARCSGSASPAASASEIPLARWLEHHEAHQQDAEDDLWVDLNSRKLHDE